MSVSRLGSIKLNLNQTLSEDPTLGVFGSEEERKRIHAVIAQINTDYCGICIIFFTQGNVVIVAPDAWAGRPDR